MGWLRRILHRLGAWVGRVFTRRTEPEEVAPEPPDTATASFDPAFLMANERLAWPQRTPRADVFSRDQLFVVGTPDLGPHLDQRRIDALTQQLDLRGGEQQEWRRSPFGHVLSTADGREALMLARPTRRRSAELALRSLVAREGEVRGQLGSCLHRVELRWPTEVKVDFDGGTDGYFTSSLPHDFIDGKQVRTLPFALPGRGPHLSDADRFELVRLVGAWLRALHANGVVHGSLGPTAVAFAVDPLRIAPLEYTTTRVQGFGTWLELEAVGEGADVSEETSYDEDRLGFATIAVGLLLPEGGRSLEEFVSGQTGSLSGLDRSTGERLRRVVERASGEPGTMPAVEEWLRVLGEPDSLVGQGSATASTRSPTSPNTR